MSKSRKFLSEIRKLIWKEVRKFIESKPWLRIPLRLWMIFVEVFMGEDARSLVVQSTHHPVKSGEIHLGVKAGIGAQAEVLQPLVSNRMFSWILRGILVVALIFILSGLVLSLLISVPEWAKNYLNYLFWMGVVLLFMFASLITGRASKVPK